MQSIIKSIPVQNYEHMKTFLNKIVVEMLFVYKDHYWVCPDIKQDQEHDTKMEDSSSPILPVTRNAKVTSSSPEVSNKYNLRPRGILKLEPLTHKIDDSTDKLQSNEDQFVDCKSLSNPISKSIDYCKYISRSDYTLVPNPKNPSRHLYVCSHCK